MVRNTRAGETREAILAAAERLFAEHGVLAVSNRQVGEAAGQGNNFAVGYHFGSKADLVRAIVHKHGERIERARQAMVEQAGDSDDLRTWVACLVRPAVAHLAELGTPTWYARFAAQVTADPALREIITDETLLVPPLRRSVEGLNRCLAGLPTRVRLERGDMARHMITHVCAERERALADGAATSRTTWDDTATGLIDAITGMFEAPVTPATEDRKEIRT